MSKRLLTIAAIIALAGACKDDDPKKYASKEDKKLSKKEGTAKSVRHAAPVKGRKKIACTDIFDAETLKEEMGEELVIKERNEPNFTAACKWHRAGETPSEAEQKKIIKTKGMLGVLPGDELCRIRINCWLPAQSDDVTKKLCKRRGETGHMRLGVYSCVQVEQSGAYDSHIYRFVDPDTKCALKVKGGPGVLDNEKQVEKCAQVAMKLLTKETLTKAK
jgi:hypothetical protein